MKKVQHSPCDELAYITSSIRANSVLGEDYRDKNDFEGVRSFFQGSKATFVEIDHEMVRLCIDHNDDLALIAWADRLRIVNHHLDTIERNLAVAGTRLFDWNSVICAIATVLAYRVGAQQTLGINQLTNPVRD